MHDIPNKLPEVGNKLSRIINKAKNILTPQCIYSLVRVHQVYRQIFALPWLYSGGMIWRMLIAVRGCQQPPLTGYILPVTGSTAVRVVLATTRRCQSIREGQLRKRPLAFGGLGKIINTPSTVRVISSKRCKHVLQCSRSAMWAWVCNEYTASTWHLPVIDLHHHLSSLIDTADTSLAPEQYIGNLKRSHTAGYTQRYYTLGPRWQLHSRL